MKRKAPTQKVKKTSAKKARTFKPPSLNARPGFNPEMKMVDNNAILEVTNTGTGATHTMLINGTIPGNDRYNRIGRKINVKSVNIRAFISTSAAAPAVIDDLIRVALIWDEQPIAATFPTAADLWTSLSNAGAATSNVLSFNNTNTTSRFRTIKSEIVSINAEFQLIDQRNKAHIEWNVPINKITVYNSGVTGNLNDIQNGALYFVCHGLNSPAPTVWSCQVQSRCKFMD